MNKFIEVETILKIVEEIPKGADKAVFENDPRQDLRNGFEIGYKKSRRDIIRLIKERMKFEEEFTNDKNAMAEDIN